MRTGLLLLALLACIAVLAIASTPNRVVKGRALETFFRAAHSSEWHHRGRAAHSARIRIVFAVRQNRDAVHQLLNEVSNPQSGMYARYLSLAEVRELATDVEAHDRIMAFLQSYDISDIKSTGNKDFITVHLTVQEAERLLDAEYHEFSLGRSGRRIMRTPSYSLPADVAPFVDYVSHTVQFPRSIPRIFAHGTSPKASGTVTPKLLFQYYQIDNPVTNNDATTQAVYENLGQSYDPADLEFFQQTYNLEKEPIGKLIGPNDPSACAQDPNNCIEATLDVQYLMAVAQNASTTYWSIDNSDPDPFTDWVMAVGNDANAPLVHSVSYGEIEDQGDPASYKRFDDEVAKLGLRGITVVVASGDDGVANFGARDDKTKCGFHPSFPASAPHVTAVGATMGPENGGAETACTAALNGGITTGGGFSTVFDRPDYQADAVEAYFKSGVQLPPATQYHQAGRGYPDVGTLGHNYNVYITKQDSLGSGTSASAPVFAAMLSLVNDARMNQGKPSVGFVNPALYSIASQGSFRDITVGENNCAAGDKGQATCCKYGFYAAAGWDPLTGLGGIQFPAMLAALVAM